MAQWYILRNGKEHGPVNAQQLKELAATGKLLPSDMVRREDMTTGRPAREVKGLFPATPAAPKQTPQPPTTNKASVPVPEQPLEAKKAGWTVKHVAFAAAGLLGLLVLCSGVAGLIAKKGGSSHQAKAEADGGKWGFIDRSGRVLGHFEKVGSFSEGYAPVKVNGKWGYIDNKGDMVVTPQFDMADSYSEGLAAVSVADRWGFIGKDGRYVIEPRFERGGQFRGKAAVIGKDGRWCVIDRTGKVLGQTPYSVTTTVVHGFTDVVAVVMDLSDALQPRYGLIDSSGRSILPLKYSHITQFNGGRAAVSDGRRSGIVDAAGRFILPLQDKSLDVTGFSEGFIGYTDWSVGLSGYIDAEGRIALSASIVRGEPTFTGRFSEGLARVMKGAGRAAMLSGAMPSDYMKVGYIDKSGEYVIPPQFHSGEDFSGGRAVVRLKHDGKYGYIDRAGRVVIEPKFDSALAFTDGVARVEVDGKWGLIDTKGNFVVSPRYKRIDEFSEGFARIELLGSSHQAKAGATDGSGVTGPSPSKQEGTDLASAPQGDSADLPDFFKVDYSYDFSKAEYDTIPEGARRHTQETTITEGAKNLIGKLKQQEGYIDASGKFVAHGAFITWADAAKSKKLREGKMLHGKSHGVLVEYYASGAKSMEWPFVHDKRHGICRLWYKNGQLEAEELFFEGNRHGVAKSWYEDGKPQYVYTWVGGKKHGPQKRWYKNGQLEYVASYQDGVLHGPYVSYSKDFPSFEGVIPSFETERGRFEKGVPKGTWKFGFLSDARQVYYLEATDGSWKGGRIDEFIAKMKYEMLGTGSGQFGPREGIAHLVARSQDDFFAVFGRPTRDLPHPTVLGDPPQIQRFVRQWVYQCSNGTLKFMAQIDHQSGRTVISARRN